MRIWKNIRHSMRNNLIKISPKAERLCRTVYARCTGRLRAFKYRERKICNGNDFSDKTFYVIRIVGIAPLMQYVHTVLSHLLYVEERGMIPVIDMTNVDNPYRTESMCETTDNVWEYYFLQPGGFSLDDIRNAKNVVLSTIGIKEERPSEYVFALNKGKIAQYRMIMQKYIKINYNVKSHIEQQKEQIGFDGQDVIGIHMRGTDYFGLKPKDHNIQPNVDMIIAKLKEKVIEWDTKDLYVCTEDEDMLQELINGVNIDIKYTKCKRISHYSTKNGDILKQFDKNEQATKDKYMNGLEYLTDILLLSECKYLISGAGLMGTCMAMLFKDTPYSDLYIFDLGKYD